jgi:hypothetical protein
MKAVITEISLILRDFSSVMLAAQGIAYPQTYFGQIIDSHNIRIVKHNLKIVRLHHNFLQDLYVYVRSVSLPQF